jgi:hypothetical protein
LGWEGICDGQGDAVATAEIVMVSKYFIAIIYFFWSGRNWYVFVRGAM